MPGERSQRVLGAQLGAAPVTSSPEENSKYRVGDDLFILLDEVLNNSTRALLVYDEFSGTFTDTDACALASVLRYNTSLISVNLCGVDIGDQSVSMLCDALARSKVRVIDLSNTYLAEEAGMSLAALAHCNPNLRTVIVDDTLIPEEIMDEIDLACTNNETLYELGAPANIDPDRTRYCVYHCFSVCDQGEFCPLSHRSIALIGQEGRESGGGGSALKSRALELPPLPREGASWRAPNTTDATEDSMAKDAYRPQVKTKEEFLEYRRRTASARASARSAKESKKSDSGTCSNSTVFACAALSASVLLLAFALRRRLHGD